MVGLLKKKRDEYSLWAIVFDDIIYLSKTLSKNNSLFEDFLDLDSAQHFHVNYINIVSWFYLVYYSIEI